MKILDDILQRADEASKVVLKKMTPKSHEDLSKFHAAKAKEHEDKSVLSKAAAFHQLASDHHAEAAKWRRHADAVSNEAKSATKKSRAQAQANNHHAEAIKYAKKAETAQ